MTDMKPLHPSHSINEVIFALQFGANFPESSLRAVGDTHERLKDELPKREDLTALGLEIKNNQIVQPRPLGQSLSGVRFSHYRSDGTADWLVRVEHNFVAVSCLAYDRWKKVWPRAEQYLHLLAPMLASPTCPVTGVGLQYVDRFIFSGEPETYSAANLFRHECSLLPPSIYSKGPLWHVHQGCFDQRNDDFRILNKLNINAAQAEGEHQTNIDQQLTWFFGRPLTGAAPLFDNGSHRNLSAIMNHLHQTNKKTLQSLLKDSMLEAIGLAEESKQDDTA